MHSMDELISQIRDDELMTKAGETLLNEEPLSEEEAKKLLQEVKMKQTEVGKVKKRRFRRWSVFLVAAVMLLLGLTAAGVSAWPILFRGDDGKGLPIHLNVFGFDDENLQWDKFEEYMVDPQVAVEDNGVTVRLSKLFYSGVTTMAEFEITTPHNGAKLLDEHPYGFTMENYLIGFRLSQSTGSFTKIPEDPDPTDNKIYIRYIISTNSFTLLEKDQFSFKLGLLFNRLTYLDGKGNDVIINGEWELVWRIDNEITQRNIVFEQEEPIRFSDRQYLVSLRITRFWMAIDVSFSATEQGDFDDNQLYGPVIRMKDGTVFSQNYPVAMTKPKGLFDVYTGTKIHLFFSEPLDLDQVAEIQYGKLTIPID